MTGIAVIIVVLITATSWRLGVGVTAVLLFRNYMKSKQKPQRKRR